MKNIVTVLGKISGEQLGFCQCHEHLLISKGKSYQVNPVLFMDEVDKSTEEVTSYRAAGGCSLVDAQPVGCGRMAEGLVSISKETGVHIIASTGFHKLSFYPEKHWIFGKSREQMREIFRQELLEGMYVDADQKEPEQRIPNRAGQIKTALDTEGLTERYRTLFLAAADAAKETGAPVMIHVENGTDPRELLGLLLKEGVRAEQMIFCHMDRACKELSWHEEVASTGAYLEYDTIGRFKYHSDEREIEIIRHMCSQGYEDRLLFSLDTTRARLASYGGSLGLVYLIDSFLPKMAAAGIPEEKAEQMIRRNSAKAFAWK
ncbi:MAG: phosphotriesterase [Lachnospiraceae bacterium]|nr:phosphotriesterase [Lachnospiraceae bacterium]MDD2957809.1 phosphotriesterase [Lachnospiraceae bacterium]